MHVNVPSVKHNRNPEAAPDDRAYGLGQHMIAVDQIGSNFPRKATNFEHRSDNGKETGDHMKPPPTDPIRYPVWNAMNPFDEFRNVVDLFPMRKTLRYHPRLGHYDMGFNRARLMVEIGGQTPSGATTVDTTAQEKDPRGPAT